MLSFFANIFIQNLLLTAVCVGGLENHLVSKITIQTFACFCQGRWQFLSKLQQRPWVLSENFNGPCLSTVHWNNCFITSDIQNWSIRIFMFQTTLPHKPTWKSKICPTVSHLFISLVDLASSTFAGLMIKSGSQEKEKCLLDLGAYFLKARVLVVQTPQTVLNFPQKDCLRTQKV